MFTRSLLHRSKLLLVLLFSQCAVGIIATFNSSHLASSDLPLEWVSVDVFAFGLKSEPNVNAVASPFPSSAGLGTTPPQRA